MNRVTRSVHVLETWEEETRFNRDVKMTKLNDIPEVILVSYVLFLMGFLFHFIGFVAPGWYSYSVSGDDIVYGGLWKNCTDKHGCYDVIKEDVEGWMEATQTFETLGFIILVVTAAIFTEKLLHYENKTDFSTWIIIGLLFASCFLIMLGFIIFAAGAPSKIKESVGYAFGMIIVSAVFLVLSGNLFIVDAIK